MFNVSINPLYRCNLRCHGCYLTREQLASKDVADLQQIKERLDELHQAGYHFGTFDIYGGEIALLPASYQHDLLGVLTGYQYETINVITNLTLTDAPLIESPLTTLGVSYDFEHRPRHHEVWLNMLQVDKDIHVLTLATPELITDVKSRGVESYIKMLEAHHPVKSVEIKPYSKNQANQLDYKNSDYEWLVGAWLTYPLPTRVQCINKDAIQECIQGISNSWSDDHVYIAPSGKFAVLEFDRFDNEYFLELDSLGEYIEWTEKEKKRIRENEYCGSCQFQGSCLSEHLRGPKSLDDSCDGFKGLLEWSIT